MGGVLAGLAGVIAMVLLVAVPGAQCLACHVQLGASNLDLIRQFSAWESTFYQGAYGSLVALFLLVWFLAHLHQELTRVADSGIYATVALLGGGLLGAGVLLQMLFFLAATKVADGGGGTIARTVFAVTDSFAFVYAAPVAALVTATSLVIVRTRWLPRGLGIAGFGAAAVALSWSTPGLGAVAGMAWTAVLGAVLAVRAARGEHRSAAGAARGGAAEGPAEPGPAAPSRATQRPAVDRQAVRDGPAQRPAVGHPVVPKEAVRRPAVPNGAAAGPLTRATRPDRAGAAPGTGGPGSPTRWRWARRD